MASTRSVFSTIEAGVFAQSWICARRLHVSVIVRVILDIAVRFQISEEVEDLVFGKSIEQTDRHRRGGLRLAFLNFGFI